MIQECKLIDIIIPAYKSQKTIIKTLDSISMQTISNDTIVTIVNDADGIGYSDIIDHYSKFLDIRELVLEKNSGPGIARQHGIDNTNCKYISFCDSDDTLYGPFALESLLKSAENSGTCCSVCGKHYLEVKEPTLHFIEIPQNYVWMFAKLYRRSFIDKYKIRFNDSRVNEDVGFNHWMRLVAIDEEERQVKLNQIVYCWFSNPNSITRSKEDFLYLDNIPGYVDNIIYAIKNARKAGIANSHYVRQESIVTMADLYVFYMECIYGKPKYEEINFKACVKFYNEIYQYLDLVLDKNFKDGIILKTLYKKRDTLLSGIPILTFYQFLEKIKEVKYEEN